MLALSFSTINNCLQPENSHNWANKMIGVKPEDHDYYHQGTEAHRLIQQYLSGKRGITYTYAVPDANGDMLDRTMLIDNVMKHIKIGFPIVEQVDFDKRCEFNLKINSKYSIRGFIDAQDPKNGRFGEIKTSSTPWSIGKFQSSMQRKIYGLSNDKFTESYLITGSRKPEEWGTDPLKIYKVPVTATESNEAMAWILKAIDLLESGDYTGGLDENGKCTDYRCYYGKNCQFK